MERAGETRMIRATRIPAALAAAAALLLACGKGKRVAGGYDDVENPAIRVSLTDAGGRPVGTAYLGVYARYQNPVRDSLALVDFIASGSPLTLTDSAVRAAFDTAKARGRNYPGRDTLEFNLYATAPGGEGFLEGFALIKRAAGWGFIRRTGGSIAYPDGDGLLASEPRLAAPVLGRKGNVGPRGLELGLKRVFIPGSPYAAALASDGAFAFAHLAPGRYELKAVSADDKVYTASDSLSTDADFTAADWSEAEVIWVQGL
jgi:hypothetical protein